MSGDRAGVVVVGAGIVGSACAMELARRGHSVLVVEAADVGAETSCRAMGWVGIYDESDAEARLCRLSLGSWEELATELPTEVEYTRRGAIWIAEGPEDLTRAERKVSRMRAVGGVAQLLDEEQLHALEPNLRPGLAGGVFAPNDVVLDAAAATRFLAERARRFGARFQLRSSVVELVPHGVLLAGGVRYAADHVVIAAGWRSPELLPGLPVRPRKGTIARTLPRGNIVRHQLAEVADQGAVRAGADDTITLGVQPRTNGAYLLGTSRQYAGNSLDVDPDVIRRILERVAYYVPALQGVPLDRTWSGLRPGGPDEVPLIGPWPPEPSWILATGHEGIGITTSLGSARLVADFIEGVEPPIPLEPYLPARLRGASG